MFKELMETACRFFEQQMSDDVRSLVKEKYGFTDETVNKARIGFAPADKTSLLLHLFAKYERDLLLKSGLFTRTDSSLIPLWEGRIMFPYIVQGEVSFFIGRMIDEVTTDWIKGKYVKQKVHNSQKRPELIAVEPIFGVDSIVEGCTLVITEGIADTIACHQAGYSAISPVTTSFKERHAEAVSSLCKQVEKVVIIMDSEINESGLKGAAKTAFNLGRFQIDTYIGELPRPDNVEKIDIADFLLSGGDLNQVIDSAILAYNHPSFIAIKKEEQAPYYRKLINEMKKESKFKRPKHLASPLGYTPKDIDVDAVKAKLPSLTDITGIPPGQRGPHPVYGSSSGKNLEISVDGDRWFCYHEGNRGEGDILKWLAVYEMHLIREDMPLDGVDFIETLKYAWRLAYRQNRVSTPGGVQA